MWCYTPLVVHLLTHVPRSGKGVGQIQAVGDARRYLTGIVLAIVMHGALGVWLASTSPRESSAPNLVELDVREVPPAKPVLAPPEPLPPAPEPKTKIIRQHRSRGEVQPTETLEQPMPAPRLFGIQPSETAPEGQLAVATGDTIMADPNARREIPRPSDDGVPGGLSGGKPVPVIAPRYDAAYLHNAPPQYPPLARRLRLQGKTTIRVLVNADGRPQRVKLEHSSGVQILDQAALEAVQHWTFVPARQGNRPIAAEVDVPLHFRLEGTAAEE
jgi:protein TonB